MKKTIIFIVGIVVGFLLSVAAYFYISFQTIGDPPNSRVEFTKNQIQKKQNELGITCAEAPDVVRKYLDLVPSAIEKLSNGERINPSSPILREGKIADEIFFTCGLLNNMAEADHIEFAMPPTLKDEELHTNITAINLALGQASADWCESKCIADTLKKVTSFVSVSKKRLETIANR